MNLRNDLIKKLKSHSVEVSVNELDKYYHRFINDINYEFTKFDGFLDLMEDEYLFNKFLSSIELYKKTL